MGLDKNLIDKINKIFVKKIKPQAVFVNVVSEKKFKKRLNLRKNKNRYDNFNINFYKKVQRGFLKLSKNRDNYFIIDSNKKLDENKNIVLNKVLKLIF